MNKSLYVRDPFREFDAMIDRAFGARPTMLRAEGYAPAVETERRGDDLVVRLELPGVDVAADVEVELINGRLVISGERRDERIEESEGANGHRVSEFRYGSFRRAFRLGRSIDADQVSAAYDAGILTVTVADAYASPAGQRIAISTVSAPETSTTVEGEVADQE